MSQFDHDDAIAVSSRVGVCAFEVRMFPAAWTGNGNQSNARGWTSAGRAGS